MSETRPSGRPLVEAESSIVFQDVAQIDAQRRLNLLPRWSSRFPWLKGTGAQPAKVLMVFSEPGKIKLLPWEPEGQRAQARYLDIMKSDQDDDSLEMLRLLQDKYSYLMIDEEHRPYLGDAALAHLGIPLDRGFKSIVYVVIYPESLVILSPSYRDKKNLFSSQALDDLPH